MHRLHCGAHEYSAVQCPQNESLFCTAPCRGGGLVGTARDYHTFTRMLACGGELNGERVLTEATFKLMCQNHLPGRKEINESPPGPLRQFTVII